jgi:hypothetical protein
MRRPDIKELQSEVVKLFYKLSGWKMSHQKEESHDKEKVVKVLGVNYERVNEKETFLSIPEVKIADAISAMEEVVVGCGKRKGLNAKMLQRAHGRAIFATSLEDSPGTGAIRGLAQHSNDAGLFQSLNEFGPIEIKRCALRAIAELKLLKGFAMNEKSIFVKIGKSITDAATPETPQMGGVFPHRDNKGKAKAWSLDWVKSGRKLCFWASRFPNVKSHIGIWEMMAVLINVKTFKESYRNRKIYFLIDNLGDARILRKGSANCPVTEIIAQLIIKILKSIDSSFYVIYINTTRNPADFLTRLEKLHLLEKKYGEKLVIVQPNGKGIERDFLEEESFFPFKAKKARKSKRGEKRRKVG